MVFSVGTELVPQIKLIKRILNACLNATLTALSCGGEAGMSGAEL